MVQCPLCETSYDETPAFCGACGAPMKDAAPMELLEADPLVGMIIDGRYRILDQVGRGGMGAVYRVEHAKMGKILAMKLLHGDVASRPENLKRFKREAVSVSQLSHINTVSVFDFGADRGMMYLVMEFIQGTDLADLIKETGHMSFERAAYILVQVCSALVEAHSKGIVHRDIKPENVIVTSLEDREDFVKVLDFGLARLLDDGRAIDAKITVQGRLLGTPHYMAPEYIKGKGVQPISDIYAVGAVLYRLITGEQAFAADTPMQVLAKQISEPLQLPSERCPHLNIPGAADKVVARAMAKDPAERYQTARELRRALVDALEIVAPGSMFQRLAAAGDEGRKEISVLLDLPFDAYESDDPEQRQQDLRRSVVIGGQERPLGTRSDFQSYSRKHRRRRTATGMLIGFFGAALLGAAGLFLWLNSGSPSLRPTEVEPNDVAAEATSVALDKPILGILSSPADRDWYCLRSNDPVKEVTVTCEDQVDMVLRITAPGSDMFEDMVIDRAGPGEGETTSFSSIAIPLCVRVEQKAGAQAPEAKYRIEFL